MEHSNLPFPISETDWRRIYQNPEVRACWGVSEEEFEDEQFFHHWKQTVYGARFNFTSGGPGYCGDLFLIVGDSPSKPLCLVRSGSEIVVAD